MIIAKNLILSIKNFNNKTIFAHSQIRISYFYPMNIAMILTGSRLFTGALFAYFFINAVSKSGDVLNITFLNAAFITAILLELSDAFDGFAARARNQVTDLGKIFDPICDAISRQTIFLSFLLVSAIPLWAFLIFLYRDSLIYLLRIMAAKDGTVLAASKSGKIKAITQAVATFLILIIYYIRFFDANLPFAFMSYPISYYIIAIPVFFALYSGIQYYRMNWNVILKGLK
ncbi:MAG: CDP-alcohol phosphatidyltransferase family protein [Chitinivibrionia bacterium]|nr:CDP-alcohol phosphatidyltransferase family protein [Chitinivibrionia bacterium]